MNSLIKQFVILAGILIPTTVFAFPEIPFCPAGGPPGWMNYLNAHHNNNNGYNRHYPSNYYSNNQRLYNSHAPYIRQNNMYRGNNYATNRNTNNIKPQYQR